MVDIAGQATKSPLWEILPQLPAMQPFPYLLRNPLLLRPPLLIFLNAYTLYILIQRASRFNFSVRAFVVFDDMPQRGKLLAKIVEFNAENPQSMLRATDLESIESLLQAPYPTMS